LLPKEKRGDVGWRKGAIEKGRKVVKVVPQYFSKYRVINLNRSQLKETSVLEK
jgi:hypothetical protein